MANRALHSCVCVCLYLPIYLFIFLCISTYLFMFLYILYIKNILDYRGLSSGVVLFPLLVWFFVFLQSCHPCLVPLPEPRLYLVPLLVPARLLVSPYLLAEALLRLMPTLHCSVLSLSGGCRLCCI